MSAKYLHTTADDNPDLHKQHGCMNGLFQIFNRQHFVTGRRITSQSRMRLPTGEHGNPGKEPDDSSMQKPTEKNHKEKGVKEGERTLVESSGSSFSSSSCSSTFSSIDYNKLAQTDPSILSHNTLSRTPSHVAPKKQPDPSSQSSQQSPDIRNIVKDSIQREPCELSVKTNTKSEGKKRVMKHIDSPRPQQDFKPVNPRVSLYDRSSRVLGRERNSALPPKDAPRFSYDERVSQDKWKSVAKVRELPRFSLDSRESSIRRAASASEPKSNSLLEDLQQRSDQRLSSVVAKLMGLEAFPDPMETNKSRSPANLDPISASSTKADENKNNQISNSPRLAPRDVLSPKLRNNNSSTKSNPRFPLEPAPLRQTNGRQDTQNSDAESQLTPQTRYHSLYGQIEKRLTELEFKNSGKDLRALKQILEAMQKGREGIEDKKDEGSYKQSQIGNNSPSTVTTPTIKGSDSPKEFVVSNAYARPAKLVQKPKNLGFLPLQIEGAPGLRKLRIRENADEKKELIPRTNKFRESSSIQSSRPMGKKRSAATYRSKQTSVSPRIQHNNHGHPTTCTSEASTPRKAMTGHRMETLSPSSKFKPKSRVWHQSNEDQLREISRATKHLSHRGDAFSANSESNISVTSQNDEATSNYRSEVVAIRLDKFRLKSGTTPATLEQPSPVSVLDATFHVEELPSPVKKISTAFTDEDNLCSDEAESFPVDSVNFQSSITPDLVLKLNEELKNKKHSNDKLRKVDSHDQADADSIASLCESTDRIHRYVIEILTASGIFKDLGSCSTFTQLHPSGHFINPHLFYVLEQAKHGIEVEENKQNKGKINQSQLPQRIHRKLIFDTTDEILIHVLISAGFYNPCISPNKLGVRSLTGKKLLEKICSEMNHLQTQPEGSLPYEDIALHNEIPGIVLDIERLIFKDLICEIVSGEAGSRSWLNKSRRQLFAN